MIGLLSSAVWQQATPDTGEYMVLGMVVFGVLSVGYVGSLIWRFRNVRRDAEVIQALEKDEAA